jgi:isochorismate hydrolase
MSHAQDGVADLHGNVPDRSGVVLLLVDVINDLDFPQNESLLREALPLARRILKLKQRCDAAGIPTVYVNDNRGKWRSDVREVLQQVQREGAPGREFAKMLEPAPDDYVVLKPKHSAFFATGRHHHQRVRDDLGRRHFRSRLSLVRPVRLRRGAHTGSAVESAQVDGREFRGEY